VDVLFWSN